MVIISSEHDKSTDVSSILDNYGSTGNSAIFRPNLDKNPSLSSAFKLYKVSKAKIRD